MHLLSHHLLLDSLRSILEFSILIMQHLNQIILALRPRRQRLFNNQSHSILRVIVRLDR